MQATLAVCAVVVVMSVPVLKAVGRRPDNPSLLPHDYGRNLAIVHRRDPRRWNRAHPRAGGSRAKICDALNRSAVGLVGALGCRAMLRPRLGFVFVAAAFWLAASAGPVRAADRSDAIPLTVGRPGASGSTSTRMPRASIPRGCRRSCAARSRAGATCTSASPTRRPGPTTGSTSSASARCRTGCSGSRRRARRRPRARSRRVRSAPDAGRERATRCGARTSVAEALLRRDAAWRARSAGGRSRARCGAALPARPGPPPSASAR